MCVRLLHNKLTLAASLADHVLYLEAYPPSAKLTATGLYCEPLGTPDLHSTLESPDDAGKIGRFGNLYSRFRPQRTEPKKKTIVPRPGDIPGSRTHPATNASSQTESEPELIGETVSLDAHELFTQLCTVVHMVKMARKGIFDQLVEVSDGMIRVWRDWLKNQADKGSQDKYDEIDNPAKDERILWVNKGDHIVGVRCAIREKKWRRDNPILVASDEEVAVSYHVEFQGKLSLLETSRVWLNTHRALHTDYTSPLQARGINGAGDQQAKQSCSLQRGCCMIWWIQ